MAAPHKHIACCVAPLAAVRPAVAEASRLRRAGPGRLSVVHAVRWPPQEGPRRTRESVLAEASAWLRCECAPMRGAEPVLLVGEDPAVTIADWAGEHGVDLLVTGQDRAGMAGGFTARLRGRAPCPVVVARAKETEPPAGRPPAVE